MKNITNRIVLLLLVFLMQNSLGAFAQEQNDAKTENEFNLLKQQPSKNALFTIEAGKVWHLGDRSIIAQRIVNGTLMDVTIDSPSGRHLHADTCDYVTTDDGKTIILRLRNGSEIVPDPKNPNSFSKIDFEKSYITFTTDGRMDLKKVSSYIHQGQYDLAISEADKVIGNSSSLDVKYLAYTLKAGAYIYMTEYNSALEAYEKAIEINSNDPIAFKGRLYAYWGLKNYDKVWADVHKVESLGDKINSKFLEDLKNVSGRDQ